jgi:uncharacterized membrane protein
LITLISLENSEHTEMDWEMVGKWLLALVAAAVAAGVAFRFVLIRKHSRGNRTVTQRHNTAGRDIIGGDKIDKR